MNQGLSEEEAGDKVTLGVELVKKARDEYWEACGQKGVKPLVAGSVGSYGSFLAGG